MLTECNHSDQVRPLADKIPGGVVRSVPELRNGFEDAGPRRSGNMGGLVDHTRDGLVGDPGKSGDVV